MTIEELELIQSMINNCSEGTEYNDPDRKKKAQALEKLKQYYLDSEIEKESMKSKDSNSYNCNYEEDFERVNNGIAEIISKLEDAEEPEDEFTIKTKNFHKARLFMNVEKLVNALNDISEFRRDLYKGYYNNFMYMTEGYKYERLDEKIPLDIPKDEESKRGSIQVLDSDDVINKISEIFRDYDIWTILDEVM